MSSGLLRPVVFKEFLLFEALIWSWVPTILSVGRQRYPPVLML